MLCTYKQVSLRLKELKEASQSKFLGKQQIVAATITGLSKFRNMIMGARPRILILEEAAELMEAHILSALTPTIEHCILIGDHKQ